MFDAKIQIEKIIKNVEKERRSDSLSNFYSEKQELRLDDAILNNLFSFKQ